MNNKFHKNLFEAVYECLDDIFQKGFYADKVIEKKFKTNKKFGSRDRAFIAENVYDIVRSYRLLYEIYNRQPQNKIDWLRMILTHIYINSGETVAFDGYPHINTSEIDFAKEKLCKSHAIIHSYPDWLYDLCEKELGKNLWKATSEELSKQARFIIRANTLKITQEELIEKLESINITANIIDGNAILIEERTNLFRTELFQEGFFEVQDYSSQQVALAMDVKPGIRVIDACAGAGGKTLHISALMQNKGKIVSMDTDQKKLDQLKLRARRSGSSNIEMRVIENQKTIKRLENSADRLLLDVPCSGLGVLKRNPDAKWKLTPEAIERVKAIQEEILDNYHIMLKAGGLLTYSTCSILPSENENQIKKFLDKQEGKFELVKEQKILPQDKGFDGFYIAVLRKI